MTRPDIKGKIIIVNPNNYKDMAPRQFQIYMGMDQLFYEEIIKLNFNITDNVELFMEYCKLYIFGSAMYESWVNEFLQIELNDMIKNYGHAIFENIERNKLIDKFVIVMKRYNLNNADNILINVKCVSEWRNRLLHYKGRPDIYKDKDLSNPDYVSKEKNIVAALFDALPNPSLYDSMMKIDHETIRNQIKLSYNEISCLDRSKRIEHDTADKY